MDYKLKQNLTLGSLFSGSGGFELAGLLSGIKPVWASEVEPFPIRVTTKRMPFVEHLGEISQIDGGAIEPVDIITFGSPCFPKETLVLTDTGYVEIEKVKVGMRVLTHKGRWHKVTAIGSKIGKTVILKGNHYGLECTPNHPIYSKNADGKTEWFDAGNMEGRRWAVPKKIECCEMVNPVYTSRKQKLMPVMDKDLFYFIGRWLGDGWVRDGQRLHRPEGQKNGQIIICDSYDKKDELQQAVEKITDRYHVEHNKNVIKFIFCGQVFTKWLTDNFGKYAYNKHISPWVYSVDKELRSALLKGILESDGYKVNDHMYKITTTSKKLAECIRILGETENYSTSVFKTVTPETKIIEGRVVNQRDYYTVQLCKSDVRRNETDEYHSWYKVKSVNESGRETVVYNLTVDEDNSYVADGIVVHNCQDLSIAGTKKGLTGNRSNLFYEAIRVIKEMREKTNGRYPKYIVWENVRGAFSSNKGNDFWKVLKEITSIKGCKTDIPRPEKWANAGLIMAEDFSVGWRLFDSQHWGVPQRRKRIYLVADLAGGGAKKILFKSEGLSGYSAESFRAWQTAAGCSEEGIGETGRICLNDQGGSRMDVTEDVTNTLRAGANHPPLVFENHSQDSRYTGPLDVAQTVLSTFDTGGNNQPFVVETPKTLKIRSGCEGGGKGVLIQTNKSATLACNNNQILFQPVYSTVHTDYHVRFVKNKIGALVKSDYKDPPIIYDSTNKHEYIIRRLTPIECARLQGFPYWWCSNLETENQTEEDIKFWTDVFETHRKVITKKKRPKTKNQIVKWLKNPRKDSAEYKMWGNGITLPIAVFVLSGIVWADSDDCKTG